MAVAVAVIAGVLGVGLAASQLIRLKAYLNRPVSKPAPDDPPIVDDQ